ncbi:alpha/beta fold hydrolase [Actinophytocola oryzae]|uniref:Pimeloyl-ACP methyl ester carboxylesterase n=1 Tax=Actinophytocola oryzae TaxID=502181 RepID=A0A4R7UVI5_9PSEU|nr:alpha/beta hydrolase [Actinophytocola oryzae]TDV37605.1 pimeloyl-ACP methyl ester carboxylesterase [Actinophytocola oryzae]
MSTPSQLTPNGADRVDLTGRYGPVAALRRRAVNTTEPRPTALLVPGYTGSKEDFAPLMDPIAAGGFDAIAIDMPGQYESGGPDDEAAYLPAALGGVIADLVGKLAANGGPVVLLGHSYGGLVARAAVLAGASIAGLTLMDSGPSELPEGLRRQVLDIGEPTMRKQGIEAAQKLREQLDAMAPGPGQPPALRAFLRERFLRSRPAALLGKARALRTEPDLVSSLARVLHTSGIPCLVCCGEFDDAWPVSTQRDMADRLDADFAVIPAARHSPNTENPEQLLDALLPTWRSWLAA